MMKSEGGQFWTGPRKSIFIYFQRQPLNQYMKSDGMMKPDLSRENRRHHRSSTILVLLMFIISAMPISSASDGSDHGNQDLMPAQDVVAIFDSANEVTTITWRNIKTANTNPEIFEELWYAKYHVYRYSEPINETNIASADFVKTVLACDKDSDDDGINESYLNAFDCKGTGEVGDHPGHTHVIQHLAGETGEFYYAVQTENRTGAKYFDPAASSTTDGIDETTSPLRSPFRVAAEYNPISGQTTISWINYNDIALPGAAINHSGLDAYSINVWLTTEAVTRENGKDLDFNLYENGGDLLAELSPGTNEYVYTIPPSTSNRVSYYSVTYNLPNFSTPGVVYHDTRFLSNNSMQDGISEDNTPPTHVTGVSASFQGFSNGTGTTTIEWEENPSESNEVYQVWVSATSFNNTSNQGVRKIADVLETGNAKGYESYDLPIGTLGDAVYCVVIVDQYGQSDTEVNPQSCSTPVQENAFANWVAEPTNIVGEYLGDGKTRISWTDQIGAEGETYMVWRANYQVSAGEWQAQEDLMTMKCQVPDGVQECIFDVTYDGIGVVPPQITSHYFVTSKARYGLNMAEFEYRGLSPDNHVVVIEDIKSPNKVIMSNFQISSQDKTLELSWQRPQEPQGTVSVYRNLGTPFTDLNSVYYIDDPGWELVESDIAIPSDGVYQTYMMDLEDAVQRVAWYAVIVTDEYNNSDTELYVGTGSNTQEVNEDTLGPDITFRLLDEDNVKVETNSLTKGDYTIRVEASENLATEPMINITSSSGESISAGIQRMALVASNAENPDKGPEYAFSLDITASIDAGNIRIEISLDDVYDNGRIHLFENFSIDGQDPKIVIYSPSSSSEGSKYLYGNDIKLVGGITDDVEIASAKVKFLRNYGTSNSVNEPWRNITGLVKSEDNREWAFEMEYASGNFEYGSHQVTVRAIDVAGNEKEYSVVFVVDWCRHREDGITVCEYENPVAEVPETIYLEPSYSDAPYTIVWAVSGVSLFSIIVAVIVIITAMSAPKKKKTDEEEDNWMSEFIGTSAEPDMDSITNTQSKEQSKPASNDEDEDDPFDTVNKLERKTRPKKQEIVVDDDDEDDDDDDDFGFDDDVVETPKKRPRKRPAARKPASRKVAKRKAVKRDDD